MRNITDAMIVHHSGINKIILYVPDMNIIAVKAASVASNVNCRIPRQTIVPSADKSKRPFAVSRQKKRVWRNDDFGVTDRQWGSDRRDAKA